MLETLSPRRSYDEEILPAEKTWNAINLIGRSEKFSWKFLGDSDFFCQWLQIDDPSIVFHTVLEYTLIDSFETPLLFLYQSWTGSRTWTMSIARHIHNLHTFKYYCAESSTLRIQWYFLDAWFYGARRAISTNQQNFSAEGSDLTDLASVSTQ